jgi:hypothetical protein
MLDASIGVSPQLSLNEEQIAVRDMARSFAAEVFAPHAVACDEATSSQKCAGRRNSAWAAPMFLPTSAARG